MFKYKLCTHASILTIKKRTLQSKTVLVRTHGDINNKTD